MSTPSADLPLVLAADAPELRSSGLSWRCGWQRVLPRLAGWPFPLAVLLLWYLGARFEWIAPQVLPSPAAVWATLLDLFRTGEIWGHLRISLFRVFAGVWQ